MKNLFLLVMLLVTMTGYAQELRKNNFGIAIGTGQGMVIKKALEGDASYDIKRDISIGVNYYRQLKGSLKLESGMNWYKNELSVTPSFYPGIDMTPREYDIQMISVPVFLRANFSKHFYINGGLTGNLDLSGEKYITDQTGLGAGIGLGGEFAISRKLIVQVNPYLNFCGLVLADKERYSERILDNGIKIGIRTR